MINLPEPDFLCGDCTYGESAYTEDQMIAMYETGAAAENGRIKVLDEELRLARQGTEYLFQQVKDADANATIQFEARKIIEASLADERAVSDRLLEALNSLIGPASVLVDFLDDTCEIQSLNEDLRRAHTTLSEVEAMRKEQE